MRLSLAEMDHEYELKEATAQGIKKGQNQGVNMALVQLAAGLINQGQSADQVQDFLTSVMMVSPAQAREYYQQALRG